MARNVSYYIDPEEEERKRLEIEELAFGPPPPPPNLGTMTRQQISAADIEAAQAAAMRPTPVTNTEFVEEEEADEPSLIEQEFSPPPVGPIDKVAEGWLSQQIPLTEEERIRQGLPRTLGNPAIDENPFAELEEEPPPPLKPPPAAVDKTAASVAQEQKGVPAAPVIGARTDAEIAEMKAGTPARARDYGNQAERMSAPAEYQKGERTDLLGFDDEEGFSRQKLIQRVQELYGEESAPERHWEDEFLRERGSNRMTDDQIRRRGAIIGFLGGAFEGDSSSGSRWADQQHRANSSFEEGRARARDRDQGSRRISRGMAEAIAATGQVSPEAAVQLRMNDSLVKNFGQYASAGGRAEGQGVGLSKEKLRVISGMLKSDSADERARAIAMLQASAQVDSAAARGQALQELTPEQLTALGASWMQDALAPLGAKLTPQKAAAVVDGDRTGLTPEQAAKADTLTPKIKAGLAEKQTRRTVNADGLKAEVNAGQKTENKVRESILLVQNNREKANEWQGKWTAAALPLKEGLRAWKQMSPRAKEAFATLSTRGEIVDQLAKFAMYGPGEQALASKVLAVINAQVKADAGSAVTGSEWDRIAYRVGIPTGTWAPFNDPAVVESYLNDAAKLMTESRSDYERIMGGWK